MEAQALHGNVERKREGGQEELERQQQSQQRLKSRIDDLIGSAQASDAEIEAASDALLNELRSSAGSGRQKAVDPLLAALRLPNLSDRVQETIAAAISLCSGAHTNHASSSSVSYDNHITCVMAEDSVGPRVDTSQDDYLFPGETSTSTRTIRLRTLDWLESPGTQEPPLSFANLDLQLPPRISTEQVFDVVMGSDVIYEERLIQPLVATMSRHLAKPHGKGLIVAPIREKRLLEVFLKEVEHYKMRATVVQVEASEWSRCKAIVNGETESSYDDDDDEFLEDEQGTMQDIDYYDAGYVSITVTHKLTAEPLDIEH